MNLDVRARRCLEAARTGRSGLLAGRAGRRRGHLDLAGGRVGVGPVLVAASRRRGAACGRSGGRCTSARAPRWWRSRPRPSSRPPRRCRSRRACGSRGRRSPCARNGNAPHGANPLSPPRERSPAERSSRPPRRRRGSPGSCPSRAPRGRARRRAHAAPEVRPRGLGVVRERRHRHQPADVAVEREQRGELVRLHPRLRRLAREIDLDERRHRQPPRGRLGVERVDELADPVHHLRLAALEVADEVPAERVAVDGVLGLQVLRSVLPDHLDPRLGERGHVFDRYVLRGRDNGHPRADLGP